MKSILFALCLASSPAVAAIDYDKAEEQAHAMMTARLEEFEQVRLAHDALDSMFREAARQLRSYAFAMDADQLEQEWTSYYSPLMLGLIAEDVGDHEPLNEWIADKYARLEYIFGVDLMEITHLRDIWVFNFTIPVVFKPHQAEQWCIDTLSVHADDTCVREYGRHFIGTKYLQPDPYATEVLHHGFSGVATYWIVFAACEAGTYGTGTAFACSSVATTAEVGIEKYVAPYVSVKIWEKANEQQL